MVRTPLHPSRLLCAAFVIVHSSAAATLLPLDLPLEAKLLLAATIAVSFVQTLRRYALLRAKRSIVEIEIRDQANAAMRRRSGEWLEAAVLGTSCVTPSLTVINLRVEGRRAANHVLLVRDNVDAGDFRKIRVLLRWARPKRPADDDGAAVPF